ncbi:phosphotransferase family protein [Nocardia brasiliensis]|uniref:phosphotransferase family protein n=1 Tax=Nocardia brasiliensis TaxID=37326 RepID=UPI003D8A8959
MSAGAAGWHLDGDPDAYYRQACARNSWAAGYYNRNVCVVTAGGVAVNVRIPVDGADMLDHRQWPEARVLEAIAPVVSAAPRLHWASERPQYQIQEYVHGVVLDQLAPRGRPVPHHVPTDVADLFGCLRKVPLTALPAPVDAADDPQQFARRLWANTRERYLDLHTDFAGLYRRLGVPADPFEPLAGAWKTLQPRPFRLLHADLHRKNMVLCDGATVFLDWELALYGDPVCDGAIHLHKMGYLPEEQQRFLDAWLAAEPDAFTDGWEHDLALYRIHETIKSAVLDAVRYAKVLAEGSRPAEGERVLVGSLTTKLAAAEQLWDTHNLVDRASVEAALRTF